MADINLGVGGANSATGGYEIANSLKFEPDNSESLKWTNISTYATSARKKTFSFSVWFKITELGVQRTIWATSANGYLLLQADGQLKWQQSYGGVIKTLNTNRLFRDTSAWYNVIIAVDSTQSTEANRVRLYVNGVEETSLTSTTYPSQNAEAENVYADHHYLGAYTGNQIYWAGYMANVAFISDAQITPSDVGEFDEDTGIWKPKEYSGGSAPSYFLEFKDSSDLGAATGLDADTLTNITAADQATDTPTNNFATGNNLHYFSNPTTLILTEGQTKIAKTANGWETLASTIAVTSGKWYMEMQNISVPESAMMSVFPADIEFIGAGGQINNYAGKVSGDGGISYYSYSGNIFYNATNASYGSSWANETNTMAIALDMDNGKVYFARANVWQNSGDPTSGATGTGAIDLIEPSKPHMMGYAIYANNTSGAVNFGGYTPSSISSAASDANGYGTFEYAPPSGYYALCTKNLAEFG